MRIALDRADYFELRALIRDADVALLEAKQAIQKKQAKFEALAQRHGFDPTKTWSWDDATCELIETETT